MLEGRNPSPEAEQSNQNLTFKEQLESNNVVREILKVASLTVVKDEGLPDNSPWKVRRIAGLNERGEVTMSAEIRVSPSLAEQTISNNSTAEVFLQQMMSVCRHVADETHSWPTEISLDPTLPYCEPCLRAE